MGGRYRELSGRDQTETDGLGTLKEWMKQS